MRSRECAWRPALLLLLLLVVVALCESVRGVRASSPAAPCSFTDGTNDFYFSALTRAADASPYTVQNNGFAYDLNVCGTVLCGASTNALSCVRRTTSSDAWVGGTVQDASQAFVADPNTPGAILYRSGPGSAQSCGQSRVTSISFICDLAAGDGTPTLSLVAGCAFFFNWRTRWACVGQTPPPVPGAGGVSGGWVFVILYLVGFTVYMVVGILVKRFKMGATGSEMVPNVDFWKDLPALVRDGFKFVHSKTCGRNAADVYQPTA